MKNYYTIMGLANFASMDEVIARYKFLVHAYHPDKFPNEHFKNLAQEEFIRIEEAYEILGKKSKKEIYDISLRSELLTKSKSQQTPQQEQNPKNQYNTTNKHPKKENVDQNKSVSSSATGLILSFILIFILIFYFGNLIVNGVDESNQVVATQYYTPTIYRTPTTSITQERNNVLMTTKNFSNYLQEGNPKSKTYLDTDSEYYPDLVEMIDSTIHDIKKWGDYLRIYDLEISEFYSSSAIISGYLENRGPVWLKYYYKVFLVKSGTSWKVYSISIIKT